MLQAPSFPAGVFSGQRAQVDWVMSYDAPPTERQHNGEIPHLSSGADKQVHVNRPARIARIAQAWDAHPTGRFDGAPVIDPQQFVCIDGTGSCGSASRAHA
jgi:hypothetical protein